MSKIWSSFRTAVDCKDDLTIISLSSLVCKSIMFPKKNYVFPHAGHSTTFIGPKLKGNKLHLQNRGPFRGSEILSEISFEAKGSFYLKHML